MSAGGAPILRDTSTCLLSSVMVLHELVAPQERKGFAGKPALNWWAVQDSNL